MSVKQVGKRASGSTDATTLADLSGFAVSYSMAQSLTTAQSAQALANLGLNTYGPPVPNPIDNAEFRIAQRGTSFTNVSSGASSPTLTLDRWCAYRTGYAANLSVTQIAGFLGYFNAMRIQRASGDTSTAAIATVHIIESAECARFAGKTVTVSLAVRAGANFSGASGQFSLSVTTGTGTDEGRSAFAGSGFAGAATTSSVLTASTTAALLSASVAIPATATEIAISIGYTPSGTAGSADYLDITRIGMDEGTVAGPFFREPKAVAILRCQRFYEIVPNLFNADVTTSTAYVALSDYAADKRISAVTFTSIAQTGAANGGFGTRTASANGTRSMTATGSSTRTGPSGGWNDVWGVSADL